MMRIISFSAQKNLREMVNVCWSKNEKIFHEILILFQFKKSGAGRNEKWWFFEILEIFEKSWKIFENVNFLIF